MTTPETSDSLNSETKIKSIAAGGGRITLAVHGTKAVFEDLSAAYPLKLLSPRINEPRVGVVYLLSYGGGLVAGDQVELDVVLKERSCLLVLSQGSTKVFKTRSGQRLASIRPNGTGASDDSLTTQTIRYTINSKSTLLLLPDPVTCFRSASYNQIQTFNVTPDGSFVILDWLTSGRKALDEDWAFTRYYSENEIFIGGRRWARDVMLLEGDNEDGEHLEGVVPSRRFLAEKLAPYSCYAMVLLYGREVEKIIDNLRVTFEMITVFKRREPEDLIWSFSPACNASPIGLGTGAIVRIAGTETDVVKVWLKERLRGLEEIVGPDVYRKAWR
ncbi:hypothetical protein AGABI1DRAFT_66331 [Agaricus bisporus var. burnettii JB137-S8]|uniref:UreD-domain-containing protein n=2 Tax=Agaricus bisporus var. burnettii TaxID=192524 RepID=K5XJD1_AGABU|nr:uncharacterized protein AGABI1DRAFT_66331 [Agaricus bisporus var. burnettii JB137-S8]EKM83578.1 hypothetical protein AGABI1DRAFT_66331 [Agaricus bisporus var. burnettii JB137-S8]KAF7784608.1 hypothetical protein Agabi119p4_773 [Agaricus bisporus var. burnettii]